VELSSTRVWEADEPEPRRRSADAPRRLHAVSDGDGWASTSDRQMMEATAAAVGLVSAKWKVELLYLLAARVRRHGRLQGHLLVSKKVLSETLKSLERDGLVSRRVFAEVPVRVEYSLTPLGRSLTGPLFALCEWAEEHFDEVVAAREEYDSKKAEPAGRRDDPPRFTAAFQIRR
jgi:DNA-binding HxlR family transcriptional regulator